MNYEKLETNTINLGNERRSSEERAQNVGKVALGLAAKLTDNGKDEKTENQGEIPVGVESKKKAENFIRKYGRMLNLFSKDSSLRFVLSEDAETFSFDAENFSVNLPIDWFVNEKYSEKELEFANYHERGHFIDMRENPEAFIENFREMGADAKRLAKKYCRTCENVAESAAEKFYYKELHTLYNCLDDIYVNRLVVDRVPFFRSGDGKKSIDTLYEKNGFAEPDLKDIP